MPYDSPRSNASNVSANNNGSGRPLMPTLASNRAVKSPLTPRLAVQHGGATASPATAPASRRSVRSDLSTAKSPPPSREDLATPVRAFINTNVTPRSSSRKSRADSAQSTPDAANAGTPTTTPKFVAANGERGETAGFYSAGGAVSQPVFNTMALNAGSASRRPYSMIAGGGTTQTTPLVRPQLPARAISPSREPPPRFFHASDARLQELSENTRPPLKKGPSFFYADGSSQDDIVDTTASSSPQVNLPSPPASTFSDANQRFFYADGPTERRSQSPTAMASPPLAASTFQTQKQPSIANHMPNLRPPSPNKDSIHLSYRKGASQIMRPAALLPARQPRDENGAPRRPSLEASKRSSHTKGPSLSSIDSVSNVSSGRSGSSRSSLNASQQQHALDGSETPRTSGGSTAPPTSIQMPPLMIDAQPLVATPGSVVVTPLSPTKGGMSQQMTEMAAQARRERKVMDLEISNSSLLAINRQLEREVRKQKIELRRYRRLTRAGRLSVATVGSALTDDEEGAELGSEDDEDDEHNAHSGMGALSDDEDDEELSGSDESALSPSALAEHDEKRIAKDEKRLRLDLSKHRQLLVDSQRMNQSLRRCLGWTEELINEGKKALSYRVRVSDVRLGGRVLRRDEDFEDGLEESHVDDENSAPPQGGEQSEDANDEDPHELGEEQVKDMGEVMSLMSPWMRSGTRSGTGTPVLSSDSVLSPVGLGLDASDGAVYHAGTS